MQSDHFGLCILNAVQKKTSLPLCYLTLALIRSSELLRQEVAQYDCKRQFEMKRKLITWLSLGSQNTQRTERIIYF